MEATSATPSKVVHVRQLGQDFNEGDLRSIASQFGNVAKVVLMRNKGQALLQFVDIHSAVQFVQFYSTHPLVIRNANVVVQFSSHQELNAEKQVPQGYPDQAADNHRPNHILLATIMNPHYPITSDVLHQVFAPFGYLIKVVIFQKAAGLQALIQYQNTEHAIQAKNQLNNQNIYPGCCTLLIQFSNLTELSVRFNNSRSRDFTNPNLPTGEQREPEPNQAFLQQNQRGANYFGHQNYYPYNYNYRFDSNSPTSSGRSVLLVTNLDPEKVTCDHLFNIFSNYGNILKIKMLHSKPDHALIQMADSSQATNAITYLKGALLFQRPMEITNSKYVNVQISASDSNPNRAKDYSTNTLNRFSNAQAAQRNMKHICSPSNVLHVSNLAHSVEAPALTELFNRFGAVQDIKVFESSMKRQAFVQFADVATAIHVLVFTYGAEVQGRPIRVSFSSRTSVQSNMALPVPTGPASVPISTSAAAAAVSGQSSASVAASASVSGSVSAVVNGGVPSVY